MSLIKKLAGETAIYGISSILSRLLNYVILIPFFTNFFKQGEYGVVSEMYAYAALLMVFFTYRMETAFFRFASRDEKLDKTFSTASIALIISTFFYILFLGGFSQMIANFLEYPDHQDYVLLFVFIIALDTLAAIPFAKLRLENRPIRFAVIKVLNIVVNIVFIFFFYKCCPYLIESGYDWMQKIYNAENRVAYVFIANLLGSATVMLLLLPEYFKLNLVFDKALFKKMLIYAMPLVIVGIAAVINQLVNIPLLKALLPGTTDQNLAQVGIYSAAVKLAILMSLFVQAFNYAAEPFFFRNASRKDSPDIYAQVGQAFALVGSIVFLGIMLYLDLIQYFLGKDFREGLGVVPILLIAFLFLGLYYNFSIWYKLKDRTIIGAYISVMGAVITLSLNYYLIPIIGYYGAAWGALTCYGFMAAAGYLTGRKYYPIPYPIGRMLGYILLAIGAYFVSTLLRNNMDDSLALILLVNTLILFSYLALIYQLEKKTIKGLLK